MVSNERHLAVTGEVGTIMDYTVAWSIPDAMEPEFVQTLTSMLESIKSSIMCNVVTGTMYKGALVTNDAVHEYLRGIWVSFFPEDQQIRHRESMTRVLDPYYGEPPASIVVQNNGTPQFTQAYRDLDGLFTRRFNDDSLHQGTAYGPTTITPRECYQIIMQDYHQPDKADVTVGRLPQNSMVTVSRLAAMVQLMTMIQAKDLWSMEGLFDERTRSHSHDWFYSAITYLSSGSYLYGSNREPSFEKNGLLVLINGYANGYPDDFIHETIHATVPTGECQGNT